MRVFAAAIAVAFLAAASAAAGAPRAVTAPAPVIALAFDGARIAYVSGRTSYDCDRIRIWNLSTRGVSRLGRSTNCEQTSTGNRVADIAIAGARALWLHYAGGNIREWTLWTATTTRPTPRRLRFVARDVDAPAPIVIGPGDGSPLGDMLPYAVDRAVVVLRANGARRFSWTAPARVVALSALAGELAVAYEGGRVAILDAAGRVQRNETYAGRVDAVRITGNGLVVQRGRTLELRDGGTPRTWTLPVGASLEDAAGGRAFYVAGGRARQLSLSTGSDRLVAAGSHVQVEGVTIAVSSGRRVSALPLG